MAVKSWMYSRSWTTGEARRSARNDTSFLDINKNWGRDERPQDVIGLHFFSSANVMRLCESSEGLQDRSRRLGDRRGNKRDA